MKIIAIDPGYERLGIAILNSSKKEKEVFVYSECFRTKSSDPHPVRLGQIQKKIESVIKEFSPEQLSIESLFFSSNQKTAMLVAEARGTIIATAQNAGLEIFEYKPQEIKVAVSGDGRADKNSLMKMLPLIINIPKEIKFDDEFDAIACGLTHLAINRK